jgi:hypothetical protein
MVNLSNISLSLKALFTGYILVIGVGLMMARAQIMLTHGASIQSFFSLYSPIYLITRLLLVAKSKI